MRGDVVHWVYGLGAGKTDETCLGSFRTRAEAEARVAELEGRRAWASTHHPRGFAVREKTVETDFEIPSRPTPREEFYAEHTTREHETSWETSIVQVMRQVEGRSERVCGYERDYRMLQTFEPFRQGSRKLALISRTYTATAVLDLATGDVIAEEPTAPDGFCPVGFYVPDWWDVHSGRTFPGGFGWRPNDDEWTSGDFGFVWGCVWGGDCSWKVQHLDLREVQRGIIRRDERFGYVELATREYAGKPPFIHVHRQGGITRVRFDVQMEFDLATGECPEWKRLRVIDLE